MAYPLIARAAGALDDAMSQDRFGARNQPVVRT
jgi:hypothetical protein